MSRNEIGNLVANERNTKQHPQRQADDRKQDAERDDSEFYAMNIWHAEPFLCGLANANTVFAIDSF
ncbi:MAG: hypothetical protein P4L91_13750 [Burkholderiaceae bacterium]|nr:hypothetical protein [Burkholderiaceae bacterium]